MKTILGKDGRVIAIYFSKQEIDSLPLNQTQWIGDQHEAIQIAAFHYSPKKKFKGHRHIMRPRLNNYTQECMVILQGFLKARVYDIDKKFLAEFLMYAGSFGVFYRGYHEYEVIMKGTKFLEIKNGPFNCVVSEDKIYLNE